MDKLDDLDKKVDAIRESIHSIDKTLIRQEEQLAHHIKRTELAEKSIEAMQKQVEPISRHVSRTEGALKMLGIVSLVLGIIYGFVKFVG